MCVEEKKKGKKVKKKKCGTCVEDKKKGKRGKRKKERKMVSKYFHNKF